MVRIDVKYPVWLNTLMSGQGINLWGVADLRRFTTPTDHTGQGFPRAIAWTVPVNLEIMVAVQDGPNQEYADEYARVNLLINNQSTKLVDELKKRGSRAQMLLASSRTDTVNIKGDFPHKTAATRAGLGWIGKNCQLVTKNFGPWIRLGTVFTDIDLPCGPPMEKDYCGKCVKCVEACPPHSLTGESWYPGRPREEILDVIGCDTWKKDNYFQFHKGHNCGICSAVCPWGLKTLRKRNTRSSADTTKK